MRLLYGTHPGKENISPGTEETRYCSSVPGLMFSRAFLNASRKILSRYRYVRSDNIHYRARFMPDLRRET